MTPIVHSTEYITAEFFKPIIDEICMLICDYIHVNDLASVIKIFFWIGGFGGCNYLRNQQLSTERNYEHCCPPQPELAVLRGTLVSQCDPSVIQQRKADATYGVGCRIPFNKGKHRLDYRKDDEDDHSQKWCSNIFSTFIERGESICTNEVLVCKYSISNRSQQTIVLTFYSSPYNNVWYTTDSGVTEIAKMSFNIAGYSRDREIEVVFEFDVTLT